MRRDVNTCSSQSAMHHGSTGACILVLSSVVGAPQQKRQQQQQQHITTCTFLVFVPGTFLRVLYNINHHLCSFRKRVGRKKKTPSRTNQQSVVQQQQQQRQQRQQQQKPAAPAAAPAAVAAVEAEAAEDAESTSEHLRIQQYAVLFRFHFWRRKNCT